VQVVVVMMQLLQGDTHSWHVPFTITAVELQLVTQVALLVKFRLDTQLRHCVELFPEQVKQV
jgi:hypothetical protein